MTDPTTPDISITRRFEVLPDAVFRAWTDPAQFAQWFGTSPTTVEDVAMDVRVGGAWRARMVLGDGTTIAWHGSYTELEPPHRLALTLADRPGDEFELVTVDFDERDGGTEMTFTQSGGHMNAEQYREAEHGWRAFFDDLEATLATAIDAPAG
jgi:uncharacterized protein YndB with AHSA1/START domain